MGEIPPYEPQEFNEWVQKSIHTLSTTGEATHNILKDIKQTIGDMREEFSEVEVTEQTNGDEVSVTLKRKEFDNIQNAKPNESEVKQITDKQVSGRFKSARTTAIKYLSAFGVLLGIVYSIVQLLWKT